MNGRFILLFGLILAAFYIDASYARAMDFSSQKLNNKASGIARRIYEEMVERAEREVSDDIENDDDHQHHVERRQTIPSGSFHGACFFDDAFGACPTACKKDGHPGGGKCRNFKCLCF
ncbi:unnamed protein product [Adineta steineri]|uniref:Knottins-like domain-containing protein n=1 Tax=Adineta steineri TaxID=433720 RepID=A0A814GI51_9BILA|nr:unnamed protein product [Adineta steineri]CAF0996640.1 unnamed protein product [Adineta steineri]CAF3754945.1 unnamed protein product [Adineta steineri]CAF3974531.1 unnamed protein product [Adineta steineri]